ncbi:MAG: hypothetical protein WDW38_005884 [Sanguina aurantia]
MGIWASKPLDRRCRDTRLVLGELTAAVSGWTRSSTRSQTAYLILLRMKFMWSFRCLAWFSPTIFKVQRCWLGPPTEASRALAEEHLLYMTAFTKFVAVLLLKLDRRLWEDAGGCEDPGFVVLWGMLFDACTMFTLLPREWPKHHLPDGHPVCASVDSVMHFLLPLTCPQVSGVRRWDPPLGRAVTANETRVMIEPAWCVFNSVCNSTQSRLPASVRALPKDFVNTLCTLACEKLDHTLPEVLVSEFFKHLANNITSCVIVALSANNQKDISPFRSLAVLDVVERGFVLLQDDMPEEFVTQMRKALKELGS